MLRTTPAATNKLTADVAVERLDVFVARRMPGLTRSRVRRLIEDGLVLVGGRAYQQAARLERGQQVSVTVPPPADGAALPEAIPLDVLYEDADVLDVNKPVGMTVHPAPAHPSATLVNAVLAHSRDLSGIGGVLRPGIVHRLDRETSGIILIAKNDAAHRSISAQLKDRSVNKVYLALVEGTPKPQAGVVDAPIARDPRNRRRMAVVESGRDAATEYRVVERLRGASLVEARPKTGRTHQIRVHLAAIGHPLVGDRLYGHASSLIGRQALHAWRIAFTHPRTGERMEIEAPPPLDLQLAIDALGATGDQAGRTAHPR